MTTTTSPKIRILDVAVDLGVPLLGIVAMAHQYGQDIATWPAVGAAALCGVLVPVFDRYATKPFLAFSQVSRSSASGLVMSVACNLAIGVGCAWAVFG